MGSCFLRARNGSTRSPFRFAVAFGAASLIVWTQLVCTCNAADGKPADAKPASNAAAVRATITCDDDTLELTNLQKRFQSVADKVAPSVVAISAAVAPVDSDDALRSDDLNVQKLDAILDHVTRTVGTGF